MEISAIKAIIYGISSNMMEEEGDANIKNIMIDTMAYWSACMIGEWAKKYFTMKAEMKRMNTDIYGVCICEIIKSLVMIAAKQIISYFKSGMFDKNMFMKDMTLMPIINSCLPLSLPTVEKSKSVEYGAEAEEKSEILTMKETTCPCYEDIMKIL